MSNITVIRNSVTKADGKNYNICELAYKTDEGKTKGMKLFSFLNKDVYEVASKAKAGDILEASFKQSEKGFWEFGSLKATGTSAAVGTAETTEGKSVASTTSKGNWETSEERAARQVLIVRQSSLGHSVAYFEASKQKPTVEDVVAVAKQLEAYVLGKETIQQTGDVQ